MIKKSLVLALGMSACFVPNIYAENPFDDTEVKIENATSDEELETADVQATEDTDNEEATNTKFPISGKLVASNTPRRFSSPNTSLRNSL